MLKDTCYTQQVIVNEYRVGVHDFQAWFNQVMLSVKILESGSCPTIEKNLDHVEKITTSMMPLSTTPHSYLQEQSRGHSHGGV
jgi:hypothetical protein